MDYRWKVTNTGRRSPGTRVPMVAQILQRNVHVVKPMLPSAAARPGFKPHHDRGGWGGCRHFDCMIDESSKRMGAARFGHRTPGTVPGLPHPNLTGATRRRIWNLKKEKKPHASLYGGQTVHSWNACC